MGIKFKKNNNICLILNYAPHYREEIFLLLDKELNCEFYFGNKTFGDIKKMEYAKFNSEIKELCFQKLFGYFYYLKGQIRLSFKNYNYYIITGQPYNISSWVLLFINKLRGKKTFIWNHGWYGNESVLRKYFKKIQFQFISGYLVYGNYAKQLMINEGLNKNKIHVIYNSLNYSECLEIRKGLKETEIFKNHFENNNPLLIFIGRLTTVKKLEMLIEALKMGVDRGSELNLVIIGDGPEKKNLEALVNKKNLKKYVWFYGACFEEKKIAELIYNADVCVSPGNIGLTAIHSLSYGTPDITHDNFANQMPEFEVIEEGLTGSFFKENDIHALHQTVQSWVSRYPVKDKGIIQHCFSVIDKQYNPQYQLKLLQGILQ